jgi:dTDP-4-dehydrorhamnose reductase
MASELASGEKPAVLIIGGLGTSLPTVSPPPIGETNGSQDTLDETSQSISTTTVSRLKSVSSTNTSQSLRGSHQNTRKHAQETALYRQMQHKNVRTTHKGYNLGAQLTRAIGSLPRVFDREGGKQFDYVFNCGGETRFSQEEKVYELRSYGLSMTIGKEAAKRNVKCFVELSTGMVYKPDSTPRKETDKLKPWSNLAKWKLKAEEDLAKIEGLNLMVMRVAHVYGPYTSKFLSTALCMARVYQSKQKEMRWLWKEDLRTNTVHIDDTVRALWHGAEWTAKQPSPRKPTTFNIVDHGNTCKFPNTSAAPTPGIPSSKVGRFCPHTWFDIIDNGVGANSVLSSPNHANNA